MTEGPVLEVLTRRLAEAPSEILARADEVDLVAVVSDLLVDLGGKPLTDDAAKRLEGVTGNQRRAVLLGAWLLHDPWFRARGDLAVQAAAFLADGLTPLAGLVPAAKLAVDGDRREELARLALRSLDLRPAGESAAQAEDRFSTLDSVLRARVIGEARAAEQRAREIRETLVRKQAEEAAAANYTTY
jgi:hypothetical protein